MKKIFIPFAILLATSFVSCNDTAKTDSSETKTEETATKDDAKTAEAEKSSDTAEAANSDVPNFSSPELQKFAEDYMNYVNESIEVTKSGDVTKMQELATKAQEWTTKAQEASAKMTPEDAQLWVYYQTKLTEKLANP